MREMYDTLKDEFDGFVEETRKGKGSGIDNKGSRNGGSQSNINVEKDSNIKKKSKFGGFLGF